VQEHLLLVAIASLVLATGLAVAAILLWFRDQRPRKPQQSVRPQHVRPVSPVQHKERLPQPAPAKPMAHMTLLPEDDEDEDDDATQVMTALDKNVLMGTPPK